MALDSMKEIFERSARENIPFWEIVLQYDMEERQVSRQASMAKMLLTWQAIQDAADSYTGTQRSVSGLVGGDGLKMRLYARRGESIGGEFMDEVIVQAISMAESNACMRRIVASPTAGSCGVVPAVPRRRCSRGTRSPRRCPRRHTAPQAARAACNARARTAAAAPPARRAAARPRSVRRRPWRRARSCRCAAARTSRSATRWPWR